jgi:hypothetical protein
MKQMQDLRWTMLGIVISCALFAQAQTNYCYNGSFTSPKGPLDGWNIDYDWTGNTHQIGNHKNVSFLPSFKGRSNVLKMTVPSGYESKIETPLIPYEAGDMYKCTFDIYVEDVSLRVHFQGYNLKPGIPPGGEPKLQNMRRMYKAEAVEAKGALWKTVTVSIPKPKISATAYNHLKRVRYLSVLMYVPGATYGAGNFYISNVRITKLPSKVQVVK